MRLGYFIEFSNLLCLLKLSFCSNRSKQKPASFSTSLMRDTILVGAASTPCTLQFKFENKHSRLLDKVIISYDIKVTSPSKELLLKTRRLRTESCLQAIEDSINVITSTSQSFDLRDEITKLEAEIEAKSEEIENINDEERRWNALIAKMTSSVQ